MKFGRHKIQLRIKIKNYEELLKDLKELHKELIETDLI